MRETPVGRHDGEMPTDAAMCEESLREEVARLRQASKLQARWDVERGAEMDSLKLDVARLVQANEQLQAERDELERQLYATLPRQGDPGDAAMIDRLKDELQAAQARLDLAEADYRAAVDIVRAIVKLL